jgi:hypothetical protein
LLLCAQQAVSSLLRSRSVVNSNGTANWTGNNITGIVGTFRNFGTFNAQVDQIWQPYFYNFGTFNKTSSGTLTFNNYVFSSGTVDVQSGTLVLNDLSTAVVTGSTLLQGSWIARANSTLDFGDFGSSSLTTNQASVTLDGANSVFNEINGLATNSSTGSFTVSGGRSFTTVGALSNSGSVTVGPSSALTTAADQNYTQTAGTTTVNGTLTNTGTVQINGGTLKGSGTISGTTSVAGGNVAPGTSPGILNTGNISFNSSSTFTVEVNGTTTAGTDYDQLNVTGTVSLGNATLSTSGTVTALGNEVILINNDGTDAVSGTFNGLAEQATVTINGVNFKISYVGGTGNDVTLSAAGTTLTLDGSNNLVITDTGSTSNDALTIQSDTTNSVFIINDPSQSLSTSVAGATGSGTNTVTIPFASVGGSQIIVNSLGGDDSLTIDLSQGNFSKAVTFDGGTQTTSDSLTVTGGGTFANVTHTATSASAGTIDVTGNSQFSYTGLEPVTDNLSATDRVFTFTGGAETITLTDATGANMTIDSTLGESVTFANPTGSLTINAGTGADTVTITSVDADGPFNAGLTINGDSGNDTVNLNAPLITFASGNSLDVNLTNDASGGDLDQISVGFGANLSASGSGTINLQASQSVSMTTGSSLVVVNGALTVAGNSNGAAAGTLPGSVWMARR